MMLRSAASKAVPKESVAEVAMFIHRISTGVSGMMFPASSAITIKNPCAKVGRHDEQDGLLQVVVNATPLFHRAGDGGEVIVRQDHVRRLFGDFRAFDAHRDTHVRPAQRRRIVHAVTGHADDFAFSCNAFTVRSLCSGLVRAKMSYFTAASASSASSIFSS